MTPSFHWTYTSVETESGAVLGGAVVHHGVVLDLRGMVCRDLEIEVGGRALIYGMVSGTIINHGGVAEIFGMAQGVRDASAQAKTIIHPDALVRGRS